MNTHNFYPLALTSWSNDEVEAACSVIQSQQTTMGRHVRTFESNFSKYLGQSDSYMVNSGSSANLLMAMALRSYLDLYKDKRNTIIIPAVGWSTSYAPFIQLGFDVHLIDVCLETFNLDVQNCELQLNEDVVAVLAINILGNPCDLVNICRLCDSKGIFLLEDNCESLGAIAPNTEKKAGSFGVMSTHSFFFSHHINTMEGGCVSTSNPEFSILLKVLRNHGWIRDIDEQDIDKIDKSSPVYKFFQESMTSLALDEDFKFMQSFYFLLPGFNLRPTEIQGILGCLQLTKLDNFIANRRDNASLFRSQMSSFEHLHLQTELGQSSYFGFGIICSEKSTKTALINLFARHGIQTRPIVSGNIGLHPLSKKMKVVQDLENANKIHHNGLFIGNHHIDFSDQIRKLFFLLGDQ